MSAGHRLMRGIWLYGGTIPSEVVVEARADPFPPRDDDDPSSPAHDLQVRHYFVIWLEPGNPGRVGSVVGSFASLREARVCADATATGGVRWLDEPAPEEKLGIALDTLHLEPLNGLRHPPEGDACGWFLWGGEELSVRDDFFQPLHVAHLRDRLPAALAYLALPPGSRFLVAASHEDVWTDPSLLAEAR